MSSVNQKFMMFAAMAGLLYGEDLFASYGRLLKPERKCLLPGCEATTTHNGGHCCAEHCREHRRISDERYKTRF